MDIKFRAWDNKAKEWLLGYELPNLGGFSLFGECMLFGEWSAVLNRFMFSPEREPGDLIVMQSTGLEDKNGRLIYDRDIVEYIYSRDRDERRRLEVSWDGSGWHPFTYGGGGEIDNGECEVVGNTLEHPERMIR